MPTGAGQRLESLQQALQTYLSRFPDAADSPAGIRQWWLTPELQAVSLDTLREALMELVALGRVELRTLPDGTELYGRAAATDDRAPPQASDGAD
jgi:hypothetical protein